ncbi:MAG: fumarylacetoacetate hydrolase family protein [Acidimicrobiales bacterium]|nr:fumarylacetoacetate hydrolase family protein [Acidimicrobiales bacterium]
MTTTSPDAAREAALQSAADRLIAAADTAAPCPPVRDLVPDATLADGYAVQRLVRERTEAGRRRVGRKIGLTSAAVQQQMGVDTPDVGVLHADMAFADGQTIPFASLLQPRIEAEVAFVLGADLPSAPVTAPDVAAATDHVVAAIEVCASRIAGWDITIFDTVADNASSGVFVLGDTPVALDQIHDALPGAEMTVVCEGDVISVGTGAACMDHPINAVVWLANAVAEQDEPLRAGEIILSGSLGPLVPARAGATYEATITGLGSVRAVFGPAESGNP